jgi:DNA polymerase-3 subunit gamma/tau
MTDKQAPAYRVLARKYRPQVFRELVGQDVLVRTLTNAFEQGRIAHAFLLTGVRGVGKTTTARIIARALNCIGLDGKGGPTIAPCGECHPCQEIAGDRHVDVLEMDAASHTGVGDIRELIEGVRYAPASARYKVYIIDEVHMLSTSAFNALLKTLEEPPPHVKFVFATTEVRKLPLTVLSRCQRFDLRRVEPDMLAQHMGTIAKAEGADVNQGALEMLARAAEGSVRDGLSLLDQAIAHGAEKITDEAVNEMLGLADRGRTLDLFDSLMAGDVAAALTNLRGQYDRGGDPLLVLHDLLELAHWLTRLKAVPDADEAATRTRAAHDRGAAMAAKISMASLARAWQILLKGLKEAQGAPNPLTATEMVLVRLAYVADLPSPAELVERFTNADASSRSETPTPDAAASSPSSTASMPPRMNQDTAPDLEVDDVPQANAVGRSVHIADFKAVAQLAEQHKELALYSDLVAAVHLVKFEQGIIEIRVGDDADKSVATRISTKLSEWTGEKWVVMVSNAIGAPTLSQQEADLQAQRMAQAGENPLVQAALDAFPGSKIAQVRDGSTAGNIDQDKES